MSLDVAVILPVYNGAAFLDNAVSSVLRQRNERWKLYVVDDASTDTSRALVAKYSDARVHKIYHPKNLGLYPALVQTLAEIECEWIVILMQDDCLAENYLDTMSNVSHNFSNVRAIWSAQQAIGAEGNILRSAPETDEVEFIEASIPAWKSGLRRGCFWTISGSLVRRDLYRAIPFRAELSHAADYDWMLRVLRSESMLYVKQALVQIRMHSGQTSARHMAQARDLREYLEVHRANVKLYRDDLSRAEVAALCRNGFGLILRRIPTLLRMGNLRAMPTLLHCARGYAELLVQA